MNRLARAISVVWLGATASLAMAPGCKKPPVLGFTLDVPATLPAPAAWFELGVFSGTACAAVGPTLSGGIPVEGPLRRLAFRSVDPSPPALGDLPRAKYAFAAVARADDCSVVATGCSDVDVTHAGAIEIALAASSAPTGACAAGSVCTDARCAPGTDNSNATVGAGCSLDLLGAGPLADPLSFSGGVASAPAVAPTDQGFLIAYREMDPFGGAARLTTLPVDNGGGSLAAQATMLKACASADGSDATGLAFAGSSGVVAVSHPACGGASGIDLFAVDRAGLVSGSGFAAQSGGPVALSNAHALSLRAGASGYLLAFAEDAKARVASGAGVTLSGTSSVFGGGGSTTGAWVATTDKVVALVASGTGTVPPPAVDAGDEAGAPPPADAAVPSTGDGTLHVNLVAPAASLDALDPPVDFPGTWASVAALGTRVAVVSDGRVPGKPVAFRVFDLGKSGAAASDGFSTDGLGKVLYADVALHQDHLVFAVERPGSISLVVYDHATTTPTFLREVTLSADPRVPSLASVRDGHVALSVSDTRVAVVWTTASSLTANDAVGGYAVFACTP